MKMFWSSVFAIVAAAVLSAGGLSAAEQCSLDPGVPLVFHSNEKYIYDQHGRVAMLRGVNMGTCYHRDGIGFTEKNLAGLKKYGFNFVRLNLGWDILEPENGTFDTARMGKIKRFIEKGAEYGIYTMPDFHQMLWEAHIPAWMRDEELGHDYLSEMSPVAAAQSARFWESEELQAELIEFLVFLAEHLKGVQGVFGYDLFNEPFSLKGTSYGEFEKCCLFPFYEKAVAAVREADPDTIIILEPHPQSVVLPAYTRPFSYSNIVYSPHVYFPHSYGPKGLEINREETPADVRAKFKRFRKDAEKMKAPWIVGEYGGDPTTYDFTGPWLLENMRMQERYFVGSAIWSFSAKGGGGWTINKTPSALHKHFEEILVRPYPQYTAGTPDKLKYDEETKVFRYRFISNAAACAPTEVFYPRALFEKSKVSIKSDCTVEWSYEETEEMLSLNSNCNGAIDLKIVPNS